MADPIGLFRRWYATAVKARIPEPDAMAVASADRRGRPSVRMVLLKQVDARGFVFCTNTTSRKAQELRSNPRASLVFYWHAIGRQVRIDGRAAEISRPEAVEHWMKRPRESRLAGLASIQSRPLKGHAALLARFRELTRDHRGREVLCPVSWIGFRVVPDSIEFWTRGAHRLHQRELFTRAKSGWKRQLLNP